MVDEIEIDSDGSRSHDVAVDGVFIVDYGEW